MAAYRKVDFAEGEGDGRMIPEFRDRWVISRDDQGYPLLIGLSGKAGSGKSTAAAYLRDHHGYTAFAFADALKDVVGLAFGFSGEQLHGALKEVPDPRFGKSPRWCLQYLGTEVFRSIWPNIWIWHLRQAVMDFLAFCGQQPVVVTDVRFLDEAEALLRMGAVLVRIEREEGLRVADRDAGASGVHSATGIPGHVSETDLDGWEGWEAGRGNHVIQNNGNLPHLFECLDVVLELAGDKEKRKQ